MRLAVFLHFITLHLPKFWQTTVYILIIALQYAYYNHTSTLSPNLLHLHHAHFVKHPMLYFTVADILIKREKVYR